MQLYKNGLFSMFDRNRDSFMLCVACPTHITIFISIGDSWFSMPINIKMASSFYVHCTIIKISNKRNRVKKAVCLKGSDFSISDKKK